MYHAFIATFIIPMMHQNCQYDLLAAQVSMVNLMHIPADMPAHGTYEASSTPPDHLPCLTACASSSAASLLVATQALRQPHVTGPAAAQGAQAAQAREHWQATQDSKKGRAHQPGPEGPHAVAGCKVGLRQKQQPAQVRALYTLTTCCAEMYGNRLCHCGVASLT